MDEATRQKQHKRQIRNDIKECMERSSKALMAFDDENYKEAMTQMEEVHSTADFVIAEMEEMVKPEEKETTTPDDAEATPPPQSSPQEPTPVPAESLV